MATEWLKVERMNEGGVSPTEAAIFALLLESGGRSVSPETVARAVDPDGWRRRLGEVRATAVGRARRGQVVITRHGKPADPEALKGVYRLALPKVAERTP